MKRFSIFIIIITLCIGFIRCSKDDSGWNEDENGKWVKMKTKVVYAEDGTKELSRAEYSYDASGRKAGYRLYMAGILTVKHKDYQYKENSFEVTYEINYYGEEGSIEKETVNEKYLDNEMKKPLLIITCDENDKEIKRLEFSYDAQNRETGFKSYVNGILSSEQKDYQYKDREATYYLYDYQRLKGNAEKVRITFHDYRWNTMMKAITYDKEGAEVFRREFSYDKKGRIDMNKSSSEGISIENREYSYWEKEIIYYEYQYMDGYLLSRKRIKTTYL